LGFTLLEMLIAIALLTILVVKGALLLKMVRSTNDSQTSVMLLADQATLVLARISITIVGSDKDTLFPQFEAPFEMSAVSYAVSLGLDADGEVVWGDPETIGLEESKVVWRQNPDEDDERRAVWGDLVRPFLEGEVANGVDDNDNGLIDEQGLSFVLYKNSVTIRLSLGVPDDGSNGATRTVETTVTIRNRTDE